MSTIHNGAGIAADDEVDTASYVSSIIVNLDDGTGASTKVWYVTGWVQFQNAAVACRTTYHTSTNGNGTNLNTLGASATTGRFQNTSGGKIFRWSNSTTSNMLNGFAASRAVNSSAPDGLAFMLWVHPHEHYGNMNHYGSAYSGSSHVTGKWFIIGNGSGTDAMMSGDYFSMSYDNSFSGNYEINSIKFAASTGNIKGRVRCYRWGDL